MNMFDVIHGRPVKQKRNWRKTFQKIIILSLGVWYNPSSRVRRYMKEKKSPPAEKKCLRINFTDKFSWKLFIMVELNFVLVKFRTIGLEHACQTQTHVRAAQLYLQFLTFQNKFCRWKFVCEIDTRCRGCRTCPRRRTLQINFDKLTS